MRDVQDVHDERPVDRARLQPDVEIAERHRMRVRGHLREQQGQGERRRPGS